MEGGPLLSDWWVKESKRFVPYLNIAAMLDDKPDQDMMSAYGLRGYPSFIFLDTDGVLLFGKEPYWRPDSLLSLEEGLGEVESIFQLRKHVAKNPEDLAARARLILIEGFLNPASANAAAMEVAAAVEGVPVELVEKWKASRLVIRFLGVFEPYRIAYREKQEDKEQKRAEAVAACYLMVKEGKRMPEEEEWFRPFWVLAFDGAIDESNEEIAQSCIAAYEDAFGVQDRYLKKMRKKLEDLIKEKAGAAG
ncbi:MAG: hypothetical protein VYD70_05025 [Planctomycetota bacterium]|nr:hypothetical protein [Planctomycetota bacterium]MEE2883069.1 hypothetical protein [Planctomycetota bacterium]